MASLKLKISIDAFKILTKNAKVQIINNDSDAIMDNIDNANNNKSAKVVSNRNWLIWEMYFIDQRSAKSIASSLKIPKSRVYSIINTTKSFFYRMHTNPGKVRARRAKIWRDSHPYIKEFWDAHTNKYFTSWDVRQFLRSVLEPSDVPSLSYIRKYMKRWLKLSYKKISWRPQVSQTSNSFAQKALYIDFIDAAKSEGFKIIQIDEFTVSRHSYPMRSWVQKGVSGFVIDTRPTEKFNIIAAISDAGMQVMTINKINTNSKIFCEFLKLLIDHMTTTDKHIMKKVILTSDGARYHISKDTSKFLVENEVMMIQTVPYCPEFSPIENFNNWVKNKIRSRIRKSK